MGTKASTWGCRRNPVSGKLGAGLEVLITAIDAVGREVVLGMIRPHCGLRRWKDMTCSFAAASVSECESRQERETQKHTAGVPDARCVGKWTNEYRSRDTMRDTRIQSSRKRITSVPAGTAFCDTKQTNPRQAGNDCDDAV
jgi:hypothetical protein